MMEPVAAWVGEGYNSTLRGFDESIYIMSQTRTRSASSNSIHPLISTSLSVGPSCKSYPSLSISDFLKQLSAIFSESMERAENQKELQLLPQYSVPSTSHNNVSSSRTPDSASKFRFRSTLSSDHKTPSLDLQLSISLRPIRPATSDCGFEDDETRCIEALKWQAAEQIRLATMEKAYAERLRVLTRREMELAQSEFSRARQMWERAREEVERAEIMKERATKQVDSTCMEITCQSCRERFKP